MIGGKHLECDQITRQVIFLGCPCSVRLLKKLCIKINVHSQTEHPNLRAAQLYNYYFSFSKANSNIHMKIC